MSAAVSVASAGAVFIGGVAIGATGAFLLRSEKKATVPITSNEVSVKPTPASSSSFDFIRDVRLIHGHPGPVSDFLSQMAYVSAYDRMHKHPHWTAEHITASNLLPPPAPGGGSQRGDRSRSVFKEDERVPVLFRSKNSDYFRSGYDRGHMVPAADAKQSQLAMDETFYLTNIAPQVGEGFNRDYWAHLENYVRTLTTKFQNLYVFTIPLYLPRQSADGKWRVTYEVIGDPPNVSVPTHFAKVIFAQGRPGDTTPTITAPLPQPAGASKGGLLSNVGLSGGNSSNWTALAAFVLPNAIIPNEVPLKNFLVPVESVERAAGLTLFPLWIKQKTPSLCDVVDCKMVIRDFSDRNKQQQQKQTLPSPKL